MSKELPLPPAASADAKSIEMIRVWIAQKKLHTVVNIGHWQENGMNDERAAWGLLLADMIRHIANAHEKRYHRDPRESVQMIRDAFEMEISNPTSSHPGEFVDE
jgi:hypothetical protein